MKRQRGDNNNSLAKIKRLREIVPDTPESDLVDCLKQCAYNVDRAAESLVTGQYKRQKKTTVTASTTNEARTRLATPTLKQESIFKSPVAVKTEVKSDNFPPLVKTEPTYVNDELHLLCHRWISNAVNTTKRGRLDYQDTLTFHASKPKTSQNKNSFARVYYYAPRCSGYLSNDISRMLCPLLRRNMLVIQGQAMVDVNNLDIGTEVLISVKIYIKPRAFFGVFEPDEKSGKFSLYFEAVNDKSNQKNKFGEGKNNNNIDVEQAAFELLQWAQYNNLPEFVANEATRDDVNEDVNEAIELNEDEFEGEDAEKTSELEEKVVSQHWTTSLPMADHPPGLNKDIVLRPYQRQALYWMREREVSNATREQLDEQLQLLSELAAQGNDRKTSNGTCAVGKDIDCDCGPVVVSKQGAKLVTTINGETNPLVHPLWQQRYLATYDMKSVIVFYINELLGKATLEAPEPPHACKGGILADAMGLGKTVMLMSLIVKAKAEREDSEVQVLDDTMSPRRTTLVVAKLSLLPQWEDELKTKTNLTYLICYGTHMYEINDLMKVDVVVTTYGTVQFEKNRKTPLLTACHWERIILDEAHCIRNQQTLVSKVCCQLHADYRWCVSGTIMQNSLDDIYGALKFLHHEPWSSYSFWKHAITTPMNQGGDDLDVALDRVRRLLSPLMIRRTKDSLDSNGNPILTLPEVETKLVKVELSSDERLFYNAVLAQTQEIFEGYVERDQFAKSYIQIFVLLQRLRQVCDHMSLTVRTRPDDDISMIQTTLNTSTSSPSKAKRDASNDFMQNLMTKIQKYNNSNVMPRINNDGCSDDLKADTSEEKEELYLSSIAQKLKDAVDDHTGLVNEECSICLDRPHVFNAVLTPCAHVFCRTCLENYFKQKCTTNPEKKRRMKQFGSVLGCPDGPCPCCNAYVKSRRILTFSKDDDENVSIKYLGASDRYAEVVKQKEENDVSILQSILDTFTRGRESSKMRAIMDELELLWEVDPGCKVVIFSQYLGFLDLMEVRLRQGDIDYFRLDGSSSLKDRMTILDHFKNATTTDESEKGTILLISMAAGGEGLNLVAARAVFVIDPWWNVAKEDQCVNRIHRIGQTASLVRVRKFSVVDSVEERIIELQGRKKYMADEVYSTEKSSEVGSAKLSLDEFRLIFRRS